MYGELSDGHEVGDWKGARNIHIGVDLGGPVGTEVLAFADGVISSFGYNAAPGDYGNVVVTEHLLNDKVKVWALHGHLDGASIAGREVGQAIRQGEVIGRFGACHENGGWWPHVHFQLALTEPPVPHDMPGVVCTEDHARALLEFPDPRLVLGDLYEGQGLIEDKKLLHEVETIQKLQVQLEQQFGFSLCGGHRATGGTTNSTFIFSTTTSTAGEGVEPVVPGVEGVVARLHNPDQAYRTREFASVELLTLTRLHEAAVANIPRVLTALSGSQLFEWELSDLQGLPKNGHGILMVQAPGTWQSPCTTHTSQVGSFLGRAHAATLDLFLPTGSDSTTPPPVSRAEVVRWKDAKEPVRVEWVREQLQRTLPHFEAILPGNCKQSHVQLIRDMTAATMAPLPDDLPQGMVHTDFNRTNLLWTTASTSPAPVLSCVLDWDFVTVGPLILDVGTALVEWCSCDGEFSMARVGEFLEQYQQHRPMAAVEKCHLWLALLMSGLRTVNWLIDEPNWAHLGYLDVIGPVLQQVLLIGPNRFQEMAFQIKGIDDANYNYHDAHVQADRCDNSINEGHKEVEITSSWPSKKQKVAPVPSAS